MTAGEREILLQRALEMHSDGALDEAAARYEQLLLRWPEDADALHLLGALCQRRGEAGRAVELIRRAIALRSGEAAYHANLGWALRSSGELEAARAELLRAGALDPGAPQTHHYLGVVEQQLGRAADAQQSFERALAIEPALVAARLGLARSLYAARRPSEALVAYRRLLELEPDHPEALHLAAALGGESSERAPAAYVKAVFDGCANSFDELLVGELGYRTPEVLQALVSRDGSERYLQGIDLGAGTGLCGVRFRSSCEALVAVEISPRMAERAAARGCYDLVAVTDLLTFMQETERRFDLFLAADTLVYLGALEPCFAAASRCALDGARFALSLEDHDGDGHHLTPSGRFSHAPSYVERAARAHGWSLDAREQLALRREGDQPVRGSVYLFSYRQGNAARTGSTRSP